MIKPNLDLKEQILEWIKSDNAPLCYVHLGQFRELVLNQNVPGHVKIFLNQCKIDQIPDDATVVIQRNSLSILTDNDGNLLTLNRDADA
jgi:hypothetical protein